MYSLLLALLCAISFGNAFPYMVDDRGGISLVRQFSMRFPRSLMGPCTIVLRNQAKVPLVFLGAHGDFWQGSLSPGIVVEPGENSTSAFEMKMPGIFEFAHWGWLYFAYDIPSIGTKTFLVYAEVSATGAYDTLGAGPYVDRNSSTRKDPYPKGRFGMTNWVQTDNVMEITIFDKDLWSAELSPATWMDDLSKLRPAVLDWPLSKLKYPGQHDAGSFGNKKYSNYILAWSWQCSDKNLYDQARNGIRWFDLRLSKRTGNYWPFHGLTDKTGDPLAWSEEEDPSDAASENTLIGQILRFINENPNEILIVQVKFKHGTPVDQAWRTIFQHLGDRLIQTPQDYQVPTLRSIRGAQRRIILYSNHRRYPPAKHNSWMKEYIWNYGNHSLWRGGPWKQVDWDKNNMDLVVEKTENWMRSHINSSSSYIFWTAQCALTPSFFHLDFLFYPSISPKALAKNANPFTRELVTNRELFKQNASIINMDWASSDENIAIAAMNFDTIDIPEVHTSEPTAKPETNQTTATESEFDRLASEQKPMGAFIDDAKEPTDVDTPGYYFRDAAEDEKILL